MEWKNIMNVYEARVDVGEPVACAPHFQMGSSRQSSKTMGAEKISFFIRVIPPGKFAIPYHFHHRAEEMFLILEGEATLRQNDQRRIVAGGDLLFFAAGPEGAHQLYNHTVRPVKYLDLTTRSEGDFCEYPDSGKSSRDLKDKRDYFRGEETPSPFWEQWHTERGQRNGEQKERTNGDQQRLQRQSLWCERHWSGE
jgi:uncharacterized cupin superfamily protein